MDLSPKCPKCSERIDKKADVIPMEKWPTDVWPIYRCEKCGVLLEEENRNIFYQGYKLVLIMFATQGFLRAFIYWITGGSETISGIVAWSATASWLIWDLVKPIQLSEQGKYTKREETSNK